MRNVRPNLLAGTLIVVIALSAYWPGLAGGFLFDDFPNLVRAEAWRAASLAPAELWRALHSDISGSIGRPLALFSFAVNHALTGIDPWYLKLTNLLVHLINGLVLWLMLREISRALPDQLQPNTWAIWAVVALWLLHPLQVSTVLYVVQRMEIGAATGILLALLFYARARNRQLKGISGGTALLAAIAAWCIGLGFKETALLAPAFALLLEFFLFQFKCSDSAATRRLRVSWTVLVALGAIAYLMAVGPAIQSWPYQSRGWSPIERLWTQAPVLVMYLKQILLPLPESLHFYYDNFPVSQGLFSPPWTAISFLILASLAALAICLRRRSPLVGLGISWFFVAHALTSNVWPLELAFEHRNYLAILGVLIALVPLAQAAGKRLHADARVTIILLPILLLGGLTHVQSRIWADPTQLAWTLENRNPTSSRASYALGERLLALSGNEPDTPGWAMAVGQFEHAARLPGDNVLPLHALLIVRTQAGKPVPDEVWSRFRLALVTGGMRPEHIGALHAVSDCNISGRCQFDRSELLHTFMDVLGAHPTNPTVLTMYANFAWNTLRDRPLAIAVQRDAVALKPQDPAMKIALAKFLLAYKKEPEFAEGKELLSQLHNMNPSGLLTTHLVELEKLAEPDIETTSDTR